MPLLSQVPYLRVRDVARSLTFYVERLGFEIADRADEEGGPYWVRLRRDGVSIMVSNRPSRFLDFAEHEQGHFHEHEDGELEHFHGIDAVHDGSLNFVMFIYVEDVDALHAELLGRGLDALDAPQDKFYGVREFLVRDPDGYYYAFAQPRAQA
jgi:catechol 2,3-dioxygenase-like lactoylglutathione lyase family enzyme